MLRKIVTATLLGIDARTISVETDVQQSQRSSGCVPRRAVQPPQKRKRTASAVLPIVYAPSCFGRDLPPLSSKKETSTRSISASKLSLVMRAASRSSMATGLPTRTVIFLNGL